MYLVNLSLTISYNQVWSENLWYAYSVTLFDNMVAFHILTDVIFVRSDIYRLKSAMRKNVFSCSKTGAASVWLDSENYSSTFYLVTFSEEINFSRKYGEQKNAYWSPKNHNMRNRRNRVCSSLLKLRNEIMRIYLSLAIRPQNYRRGDYAKHNRTNKIN